MYNNNIAAVPYYIIFNHLHSGVPVQKFSYTEDGCHRTYTAKCSLKRHLESDHGKEFQGNGRCICKICSMAFVHAKSLMKHYEEHGAKIGKYGLS